MSFHVSVYRVTYYVDIITSWFPSGKHSSKKSTSKKHHKAFTMCKTYISNETMGNQWQFCTNDPQLMLNCKRRNGGFLLSGSVGHMTKFFLPEYLCECLWWPASAPHGGQLGWDPNSTERVPPFLHVVPEIHPEERDVCKFCSLITDRSCLATTSTVQHLLQLTYTTVTSCNLSKYAIARRL